MWYLGSSVPSKMQQLFLDAVKQAWESADVAPGPQPPRLPISEDSGPWPLPLYPVLGDISGHRGDYDGRLLSSPCWRLPSVYERYRVLTRAQSPLEPSPAQPSPGLWPEARKILAAPNRAPEPAEETAMPQISVVLPPDAGEESQHTDTCDRAHPPESPTWGPGPERPQPDFLGYLWWILRAVRETAGCCGTFWKVQEPCGCRARETSEDF